MSDNKNYVLQIKISAGSQWMDYVFRSTREECEEVRERVSRTLENAEDTRIRKVDHDSSR